jgi:WD40 repeat protein
MSPHVHVWDAESGRLLHTLAHIERVRCVAFNPTNPALLATGGWDRVARIWNISTGKLVMQLPDAVIRLQFSPDGTELITSCGDGRLRVWDWKAGKLKDGLSLHPSLVQDFAFTADRRWLVSLGTDSLQVTDWRTKTAAGPLWNLKPTFDLELAIPAGERRAIVGGFSGSLVGYDLEKMVSPAPGPTEDLVQLAELAAGRRILSQGNVVPLSSAEWADRWQRLQRDGSLFLPRPPP